jgi:hypothetical protein
MARIFQRKNNAGNIDCITLNRFDDLWFAPNKNAWRLKAVGGTYLKIDDVLETSKNGDITISRLDSNKKKIVVFLSNISKLQSYCNFSRQSHWLFGESEYLDPASAVTRGCLLFVFRTHLGIGGDGNPRYGIRVEIFFNAVHPHLPSQIGQIIDNCCPDAKFEKSLTLEAVLGEPVQDDDGEGDEDP